MLQLSFLRYCNWSFRIRAFDITVVPFVVLHAVLGTRLHPASHLSWPSIPGVEDIVQLEMHRGLGLQFLEAVFAHGLLRCCLLFCVLY
jgi:hypothetical protein